MLRRSLASTAVLAALTLPAAAQSAELSAGDTQKIVAFFDKVVDTMLATKSDCAKMASAIDKQVTQNAAMLRTVMKQLTSGKTLPKDAEAKMTEKMSANAKEFGACAADPAVNKAMMRIENPDLPAAPSPEVLAQVKAPVADDLAVYEKKIAGKGPLLATIKTSVGTVRCQLLGDKAPITVANFVGLATGQKPWLDPKTNKLMRNKPYYDGTIFHRVIPDFMIQGGDPTGTGTGGPGYTFADEQTGVKMTPGVLAMANSGPSTNGSQFFITESSPSYLDGKHTVFGTCGPLDVVSKIARVKRDSSDKPATAIKMKVTISRGTL